MKEEPKIFKCKNCGNSLTYSLKDEYCICQYCRTKYQIDELGNINLDGTMIVKLKIDGKICDFYVGRIEVEPTIEEYGRYLDGTICAKPVKYFRTLTLVEY